MTPLARSDVPGVAWPSVPAAGGSSLLALQWQLQQSERWPVDGRRAQQLRQLAALRDHCVANAPFWRARLAASGLAPGAPLTWEAWRTLPVLTRAEAQAAGVALHAQRSPPEHGRVASASTSGSTGMALTLLKTELAQFFWLGFGVRELLWHGWDTAGRLAVIREDPRRVAPPPSGLVLPDWGAPISRVFATGPAARLDMQTPVALQAEWLRRQDPCMLLTWPSNLAALARHCRDAGIRPPGLRVVRTLAETVTPALRALCREAWNIELADAYSAEEAGIIALQCPSGPHYHIQDEGVLVEVLDEAGQPCAPGGTGQVVVTPLHNFAMPLLRYALGDDAEMGQACACGRTLPTLARIIGRTRDRLLLPGGERRFAYNPSEAFASLTAIVRYQIAQVALDTVEVRLQARAKLTRAEEALVETALEAAFQHRFRVRFVYNDAFSLKPGEKFRDIVCEILG